MSKKNHGKKSASNVKIGDNSTNEIAGPDCENVTGKKKSPYVYQRDKITLDLNIRQRDDLTENQKKLMDIILDKKTKMVFVEGPAGTSKTFIAVLCGLMLLQKHSVSDLIYIRSVVESASKSLGFLPGDQDEKMGVFLAPLFEKLDEMLPKCEIDKLVKDNRIEGTPVNYLRGASFNAKYILVDEAQNLDYKELTTVVTRLGAYSKMIIVGDRFQSDINGKSGFMKFFDMFNDEQSREEGIHSFCFTRADVVRSGVLKYILERLENAQIQNNKEPMFPPK